MPRDADILIVGGGSAGAVLANRLSADRSRSVLLIEAGESFRPNLFPPVFAEADIVGGDADQDWGYQGATGHEDRVIPASRAKVLGGCSAHNAGVATRALPSDFARWSASGLDGWSFEEVLPRYRSIENTPDGDERFRGRSGPLPIRQRRPDELTPALNAFVEASTGQGFAAIDDFNGPEQAGASACPLNVISGRRINTGIAFLDDGVRTRPNLTIVPNTEIDRVLFDGDKAVGVVDVDGRDHRAGQVILSGGTYGSPAILMRSGIGPASHLEELGIPVLADLPVGEGLQDHPLYYNVYELKPEATNMHPVAAALLWAASSEAEPGDLDLQVSATHIFEPTDSPSGGAIVLAVAVTQPQSRGSVRLADRDPRTAPVIDYNLIATPSDMRRMLEGISIARRIGRDPAFAQVAKSELSPGEEVDDEESLRRSILAGIDTYDHPTSTVRMGEPGVGVVDSVGRVHGVERLSVVDASIMPMIPSGPTNVTTMMIAEHIAARAFGVEVLAAA